jgi:collagen type VII alpha
MLPTSKYLARGLAVFALGLSGVVGANTSQSNDVLAIGPVELVDATSVTVLGNSYRINDTTGIQVGDKVAVHGVMQPSGSVVYATVEVLGTYTAGADTVFEKGVVTSVDSVDGTIAVSGSCVDYTAALAVSGTNTPQIGDTVAVTGIQPASNGVVLGDTTQATPTEIMAAYSHAKAAGVTGSGGLSSVGVTGSGGLSSVGVTGSGGLSSVGVTGSGGLSSVGVTGSGGLSSVGVTGSGGLSSVGVTGSGGLSSVGVTGSGGLSSVGVTGSGGLSTAGVTGSGGGY